MPKTETEFCSGLETPSKTKTKIKLDSDCFAAWLATQTLQKFPQH